MDLCIIDLKSNRDVSHFQVASSDVDLGIYKTFAQNLTEAIKNEDIAVPAEISFCSSDGTIDEIYNITNRSGTVCIQLEADKSIRLKDVPFPKRYLTMVNAEHNNYKFYQLEDKNGEFVATYGRIGSRPGEMFGVRTYAYDKKMFWIKYYEKVLKGYIDQSDIYLSDEESKVASNESADDSNKKFKKPESISAKLYNTLYAFAKHLVKQSLVHNDKITVGMIDASERLLKELYEETALESFNKKLMELLSVCPRRVDKVYYLLANTKDDFKRIIMREENLVDAMKVVSNHNPKIYTDDDFVGIKVYNATQKQKDEVLSRISDTLKPKVKNVYRVLDGNKKDKFNSYLKANDIHTVKQFWHGSRNENWLSIIQNGLSLRPNAQITGKMFGNGIYFAPSSMKSWGYTSFLGTRWANGHSNTAFLGLYACAYGKPKDVTCAASYSQNSIKPYNCVHAHKGVQLLNDEVIFYDEDAMVLNYLVEFSA